jgi:glycosyltransferase involved in cell wall biosynthesis
MSGAAEHKEAPLRIVLPLLRPSLTGGTRITLQHAAGLAALGHHVILVLPEDTRLAYYQFPANVEIRRVKVDACAGTWLSDLLQVWSVGRAIPPCDVILATSWQSVCPALIGKLRAGRGRIVYLVQHLDSIINAQRSGLLRWRNALVFNLIYRLPVQKLVVSSWLQRMLAERYQQDSICVPNGVDRLAFTAGREPHWQPPTDRYDILCTGRAAAWKGFADVVQAVRLLYAEDACVRLIVATREELELPADLPVTVVQPQDDAHLGRLYQSCSVFVLASWSEGFGLPALEALACGAPLITTACGGVEDFARHGHNCLIVRPQQPTHLYEALRRLKEDPALAQRLARNGLDAAREWGMDRSTRRLETVLRQLATGR